MSDELMKLLRANAALALEDAIGRVLDHKLIAEDDLMTPKQMVERVKESVMEDEDE